MRTAFYELHQIHGGKIIDFHGWEMPLQYSGIIDEHITTRSHVGIFDVSHMGRFEIKGEGSRDLLQSLLTNDIAQLNDYRALYSPMCNQEGGIIDDLIVYRKGKNDYILVVNASNRIKDYAWISSHLTYNVEIHDMTFSTSLIAVQGPCASDLMCKLINDADVSKMKSFDMIHKSICGIKCMVSRTGYTGEDGFEIMFDSSGTKLWDTLLETGKEYYIKPCGLGSRDSLRLEAGLLLHGNDMDENTTPLEVPLKWAVKFDKGDFIGKQKLLHKKVQRKLVGFEILESKRIARHKNDVFLEQDHDPIINKVGTVTSGGFSPILHKSIGFCFVPSYIVPQSSIISIDIGGKLYRGRILESIRFYRRPTNLFYI